MATQQERARAFKALHVKNDPIILYNAWDPGSAQAVASQNAKAIALGSHGVANAFGYEDGERIPLELVVANAERVTGITDLPVTMDFETGYGDTPEEVERSVAKALQTGIVGVNIEDQIFDATDLRPLEEQVERLKAVRSAANNADIELFINARSDLFKNTPRDQHNETLLDEALERARNFKEAGADGFFLPGIADPELIKKLCDESPLPVNVIWLPGLPGPAELAKLGASRISYGPGPYLAMIEWLKQKAQTEINY